MNRIAALGAKRLRNYFSEDSKILEEYSVVLAPTPDDEKLSEDADIFDEVHLTDLRCSQLLDFVSENEIALTAFELAILSYIEPITGELLDMIAMGNDDGVTLETAARVCGVGCVSFCLPLINDAYARLRVLLSAKDNGSDIARSVLKAEYSLIQYLAGLPVFDVDTSKFCREYNPNSHTPSVYGIEDEVLSVAKRLENLLKANDTASFAPITVVISGERESGKGRALERIAYEIGESVLFADAEYLLKADNRAELLKKLYLHCFLEDTFLCIENLPKGTATDQLIKEIRRDYCYFGAKPLALLCEDGVKPLCYLEGRLISLSIKKTNQRQAYLLWKGFLEEYGIYDKIDVVDIASKMNLKAGQVKRICELIVSYAGADGVFPDMKQIYQFCYDVLDDGRYENIKQVDSDFTLDDLKVGTGVLSTLKDICHQVELNAKVYHSWGMAKKYEYGRCVSVILAGPPGTGKTMAVHALANELDLKLYKVDLSQMVDKYIGETEKRLEEVFQKAEKSHMILFFDEADALMGKRSETKDSKDKYANTEVAYILQRIEEFDGIVILSTNYLQNIDAAFMRRIKYIVRFDLPDSETRKNIWKSSFAKEVPLSDDIDWEMLSEKFNLSGGNIKNIVLNATFLAAAEDKAVNMEHIMKSLIRENAKDNKVTFVDDYGDYSHLAREMKE